jgi:hypothetical protein
MFGKTLQLIFTIVSDKEKKCYNIVNRAITSPTATSAARSHNYKKLFYSSLMLGAIKLEWLDFSCNWVYLLTELSLAD